MLLLAYFKKFIPLNWFESLASVYSIYLTNSHHWTSITIETRKHSALFQNYTTDKFT